MSGSDASTVPARRGGVAPARRTLLVMIGDEIAVRPLPLAGVVTIGRSQDCEIRIDHPSISRCHLALQLDDATLAVIDRGGTNGTTLRGVRLPAGVAVEIEANEVIGAGDVALVIQELGTVGAAAPAARPGAARPAELGRAHVEPVVRDAAMRRLYDVAARVARGTISVLIVGETGTGKEVLAEHLHRSSPRAKGPLVRVNCAAFADALVESELFGHEKGAFTGAQRERRGLLETADGGTVVLDEIGEMPPAMQAKLLRVLEERAVLRVGGSRPQPIDVRFVAATNRDLETASERGAFRRDLYFRLAGAVLAIPPLRERPDEIIALATTFLTDAAARAGRAAPRLDEGALAALRAHAWPGNVRELRNVIERAVLVTEGDRLTAQDLEIRAAAASADAAAAAPAAHALDDELAALERQRILEALDRANGNQTQAARSIGMPLRTFIKRIERYGIERPRKR